MKKLHVIHLRSLHNSAHYDFFVKLAAIFASSSDVIKTALASLRPVLLEWLSKENILMQWVKKSAFTKQIAEADKKIDNDLARIRLLIDLAFRSPHAAMHAAGNRLLIMLKQYGYIAKKSYDNEAGDIRALINQLTGSYAADAATVGITELVTSLKTNFNTFGTLLRQRETEQGKKPEYTFKEVRKGIDSVYRQIEYVIKGGSAVGASTDFDALIELLNPDIDRLNNDFHRSRKDISEGSHTVISVIPPQAYTGKPVIVIPEVYYREDGKPTKELVFTVDFTVTYRNNKDVGTAKLIIHGKGKYKGLKGTTFNIVEREESVNS